MMKIVYLLSPILFDYVPPEVGSLVSQSNLLPGQPVGNALRNFSEDIGNGVSTSNGQDAGQECTHFEGCNSPSSRCLFLALG